MTPGRRSAEAGGRAWLRSVAVVATVAAALLLSGPARAMPERQMYLQFNLCGNACNRGGLQVVAKLAEAIEARWPFAVTLNEVCENQFERLRADLVSYQARFDPTGPTCHNGARYGNAILVRAASVALVGGWDLPNPAGDETRRLMCLGTQQPRLVVCVTHISNYAGNISAQVSTVAAAVGRLSADRAVLLGGDFNTDPVDPQMIPLYRLFREASGRPTRYGVNQATYGNRKFDYMFSNGNWSSPLARPDDIANGLSDHKALWATAILVLG